MNRFNPESLVHALKKSGWVLLESCEFSLQEFEQFTATLCDAFHHVGTRQPSGESSGDGFTSEVSELNFELFAHSEGAYRPYPPPPDLCFFNCLVPPSRPGGETLLFDGCLFLQKLAPDLRKRFEEQGVIYQALWDTKRWQTEFQVGDTQELDELLRQHPECSCRQSGDSLEVRCHLPAIQPSLGGSAAFANGLLAHLPRITHPRWRNRNAYSKDTNRVFFGDGEEIPEETVHQLIDTQDEVAQAHNWRQGDLLILDNHRYMHGRLMTDGACQRQIRSRFGRLRPEWLQ